MRGGSTLWIREKVEVAGALKAFLIYLIMDAQLNIQNKVFDSAMCQENAMNAGTRYGAVCGSDWGWKDTPSLELA